MPLPILAIAGFAVSAATAASIAALHRGKVVVPRVADWGDEPPGVFVDPTLGVQAVQEWTSAQQLWIAAGHAMAPATAGVLPPGARGIYVCPPPPGWLAGKTLSRASMAADFDGVWDDAGESLGETAPEDEHTVEERGGRIHRAEVIWDGLRLYEFDRRRVAAHELGHALGYLHCTARLGRKSAHKRAPRVYIHKAGHLMNPRYEEGGYDMTGCAASLA